MFFIKGRFFMKPLNENNWDNWEDDITKPKAKSWLESEQSKSTDDKPGLIDIILSKAISRKLTVFAISTLLLWQNILDADKWYQIALLYIGMQAMEDMVKLWKLGE